MLGIILGKSGNGLLYNSVVWEYMNWAVLDHTGTSIWHSVVSCHGQILVNFEKN